MSAREWFGLEWKEWTNPRQGEFYTEVYGLPLIARMGNSPRNPETLPYFTLCLAGRDVGPMDEAAMQGVLDALDNIFAAGKHAGAIEEVEKR